MPVSVQPPWRERLSTVTRACGVLCPCSNMMKRGLCCVVTLRATATGLPGVPARPAERAHGRQRLRGPRAAAHASHRQACGSGAGLAHAPYAGEPTSACGVLGLGIPAAASLSTPHASAWRLYAAQRWSGRNHCFIQDPRTPHTLIMPGAGRRRWQRCARTPCWSTSGAARRWTKTRSWKVRATRWPPPRCLPVTAASVHAADVARLAACQLCKS